jgi:glycosyltransferase involved in cell wall biosynthesis
MNNAFVMDLPLVSCICITNNRTSFLEKAIRYFSNQTYLQKELIVAFATDDLATDNYLSKIDHPFIRPLKFSNSQLTLGDKRNLAIEFSSGFYFCIWDDDDWYAPNRIEVQVNSLKGTAFKSSALSTIVLFDGETNEAYVSATRWAWEATLFCEKTLLTSELRYAQMNRAEDSPLLYSLKKSNLLLSSYNPGLYIYVYHGNNTSERSHWDINLLAWAKKLPEEHTSTIMGILNDKVNYADASLMMDRFLTRIT